MSDSKQQITEEQDKEVTVTDTSLSNLNRGGRLKGSKNKTTLFKEAMRDGFEEKLMTDGKKVFDACVAKAIGHVVRDKDGKPVKDEDGNIVRSEGDTTAMKIIMDRIIPVADVTGNNGSGKTSVVINVQGMETNIDVIEGEVIDD